MKGKIRNVRNAHRNMEICFIYLENKKPVMGNEISFRPLYIKFSLKHLQTTCLCKCEMNYNNAVIMQISDATKI